MQRYDESTLRQRAEKTHRQLWLSKVTWAALCCIAILIILIYLISLMYTKFGSFTVAVNKYDQIQYGLSLSEHSDFSNATSNLLCRASKVITNIDGQTLQNLDLGAQDGEDNGDNYMCYTFYCKNTGRKTLSYEESMVIANMTLGIEKAVRIRLITKYEGQDAFYVDYARAAGVENGEAVAEPGTEIFYSKNTVMRREVNNFEPGQVTKYTVVIWLEGPDPDCLDDIIGGEFKVDMKFQVLGTGVAISTE